MSICMQRMASIVKMADKNIGLSYRIGVNAVKDKMLFMSILNALMEKPDKQTAKENMFMLPQHVELLNWLRKLPLDELEIIEPEIAKALKIHLDLQQLAVIKRNSETSSALRNRQMEQCRWMIQHNARNNMIQSVCFLLTESDIREIRDELNIPTQVGRTPALPIEEKLSIQSEWQRLSASQIDIFEQYQQLQEAFPQYDLGRLNAAINGI